MSSNDIYHMQDIDYYFILKNRTWELENPLRYSSDSEVVKYCEEKAKSGA